LSGPKRRSFINVTEIIRHPQNVWIRRAMFQVHLWTGLALAVYIVVLSATGSLLVYRNEINTLVATPKPPFNPGATLLTPAQIRDAAQRAYPGWTITSVSEKISRRAPAYQVELEKGTGAVETKGRYFDPYTGADLGDSFTRGERGLYWIVELHDNLLLGNEGKFWNGAASIVVTVTCLTGLVVWWPGISRWKRSLVFKPSSSWRRLNWDLHSASGFWLFLFLLMWAVSGVYLGIPDPFARAASYFANPDSRKESFADVFLFWLARLHFGRWRDHPSLKIVWVVIGLVPTLMAVTGCIMWWNRVVRKRKLI
jgi:uncharacterized iron-regulated membrane protein